MRVTLTNPATGRRWRLRPYSNGQCLLIERTPESDVNPKNGRPVKSEWVSCDKYPVDVEFGVETMVRMALMDTADEDGVEVDVSCIADVTKAIEDKVKSLEIEVEK